MRSRTRLKFNRPAFTLIELLVVIAIIAVLIALLVAGCSGGPRGCASNPVHQQPETNGPGIAQLRVQPRLFSDRGRVNRLHHHILLDPHSSMETGAPLRVLLPFAEGSNQYNAMNFSVGYWEGTGHELHRCVQRRSPMFLCPSAARVGQNRDAADPSDALSTAIGQGYGYTDYGATVYTDIDPTGTTTYATTYPATPYRNKYSRANGLLKQGMTKLAECTDGLSNTIAIGEDAGRDETFISPYTEYVSGGGSGYTSPPWCGANTGDCRGLGPWSTTAPRR